MDKKLHTQSSDAHQNKLARPIGKFHWIWLSVTCVTVGLSVIACRVADSSCAKLDGYALNLE